MALVIYLGLKRARPPLWIRQLNWMTTATAGSCSMY